MDKKAWRLCGGSIVFSYFELHGSNVALAVVECIFDFGFVRIIFFLAHTGVL